LPSSVSEYSESNQPTYLILKDNRWVTRDPHRPTAGSGNFFEAHERFHGDMMVPMRSGGNEFWVGDSGTVEKRFLVVAVGGMVCTAPRPSRAVHRYKLPCETCGTGLRWCPWGVYVIDSWHLFSSPSLPCEPLGTCSWHLRQQMCPQAPVLLDRSKPTNRGLALFYGVLTGVSINSPK
jgi:hypothetical protein